MKTLSNEQLDKDSEDYLKLLGLLELEHNGIKLKNVIKTFSEAAVIKALGQHEKRIERRVKRRVLRDFLEEFGNLYFKTRHEQAMKAWSSAMDNCLTIMKEICRV